MDPFYILLMAWFVSITIVVISIAWSIDYADAMTDEEALTCDREFWTSGWAAPPSRAAARKQILVTVAVIECALMVFIPMLAYSYPVYNSYRNVVTLFAYSVGVIAILAYSYWKKTRKPPPGQRDFQCLYRTQLTDLVVLASIATYVLALAWFVYSFIYK